MQTINTLVFAGGIVENSSEVRRRICEGLEFLGNPLEEHRNAASAPVISPSTSEWPSESSVPMKGR